MRQALCATHTRIQTQCMQLLGTIAIQFCARASEAAAKLCSGQPARDSTKCSSGEGLMLRQT
eukprot:12323879-Alexandrium_andersonii.AAC.1